jgi:hypothetical protein
MDGSQFELPNFEESYCLFHDSRLQVNIRVGVYGLVKEIVVFIKSRGIVVHADTTSQEPEYFIEGRKLLVPTEEQDRLISTRVAPLHFSSSPLNQLDRYHENALFVNNLLTIVGGSHPQMGAFFNIAVHVRADKVDFPSVLQLPLHPLRDVGFSASTVADVWFDIDN